MALTWKNVTGGGDLGGAAAMKAAGQTLKGALQAGLDMAVSNNARIGKEQEAAFIKNVMGARTMEELQNNRAGWMGQLGDRADAAAMATLMQNRGDSLLQRQLTGQEIEKGAFTADTRQELHDLAVREKEAGIGKEGAMTNFYNTGTAGRRIENESGQLDLDTKRQGLVDMAEAQAAQRTYENIVGTMPEGHSPDDRAAIAGQVSDRMGLSPAASKIFIEQLTGTSYTPDQVKAGEAAQSELEFQRKLRLKEEERKGKGKGKTGSGKGSTATGFTKLGEAAENTLGWLWKSDSEETQALLDIAQAGVPVKDRADYLRRGGRIMNDKNLNDGERVALFRELNAAFGL